VDQACGATEYSSFTLESTGTPGPWVLDTLIDCT
jgi:hypothetical protein